MATGRNDRLAILDWHPEMILVSESPVTWKGFLIISHINDNILCSRVKLKLVMPNYPSFHNAEINFGKQIVFLRNKTFSEKVKELMKSAQTVQSFLIQLQLLIGKCIPSTEKKIRIVDFKSTRDFLEDLKTVLKEPSDVQLSSNRNLSIIKLSLRDVSLVLRRCNDVKSPWEVISSDMSAISSFKDFEKNVTSLSVLITKFKWQVEILENAWEQLKEIDENCWVIDPPEPNKCHMYRRIHLSQSISVIITIDPLQLNNPKIDFVGSDNEVKKQKDAVSKTIQNWNKKCTILENLRMLLNMYEFPEQQDSLDDSGIIGNRECGICFSEKSETDELPNKICNNEKCLKQFHSVCLSKWLQINAENQVVFNHIYGNCTHCKEKISCPI